ncbi:MAG: DUF1015 domain-containing protein [Myxococcota bacterium]|nr:DUF1015 domain-containing protein [Myxococcota bacterium]
MSELKPFRALRYDGGRVDLGRVLVPPYDVISVEDRVRLYERDPHCAVRLELTRDVADEATTDYAEVGERLAAWQREGVLVRDPRPAYYALRLHFRAPDGSTGTREGFFALLRLEDYERRVVRPHERTLAGPKADRLKILRASRANLSSVFLLYEDREDALPGIVAPDFADNVVGDARDEAGSHHLLARVDDPARIEALTALLAERPLVIADGHHRYETALAYRDECRRAHPDAGPDAPWEFLLVYVANAFAPGTLLLPIHRLIVRGSPPSESDWSGLSGWTRQDVDVESEEAVPDLLAKHLDAAGDRLVFAADDASGRLRIFSRERRGDELSVRAIHREVIDGVFGLDEEAVRGGAVAYPKSAAQTARDLRAGKGRVALYLRALEPDDVFRATADGEVMPQKSTFFFPKLPTGLVFRLLDDAGVVA